MMHRLLFILSLFPAICFSADYDRSSWGTWADLDKDGLNTRQEILHEYNVSGVQCHYTKKVVPANKIDIDHIIPVKYAWDIGANKWTKAKRIEFYNDPENLVPSLAEVNRAKGAKGPDEWLPEYGVPEYIDKWEHLCTKYTLDCDFELLNKLGGKQ